MTLRFRVSLSLLMLLAGGGGAGYFWFYSQPSQPKAVVHRHRKTDAQRLLVVPVENEFSKAKREIKSRALALLAGGKYSDLDATAADFRNSQASFENGYWKLSLFYQAVSDVDTKAPEAEWKARLTLLRRWFEEDTECITSRVAMARALIGYAWHARGNDWASKVPKDAWPIVNERVTEAKRILAAARNLPEKCPCWYSTWMFVAMLDGPTREQYDTVFQEALKAFPAYTPFYFMKTWYLQERWYGKRGEWESFAATSADNIGGDKGDILYAQILWHVHDLRVYGNPIGESAVQWPRAQHGFEALRQQFPNSIFALSEYCSISGFAPSGARQLMRNLFTQVGNRVDLAVWTTTDLFLRDRRWACSN
jgi:hypothetical protein